MADVLSRAPGERFLLPPLVVVKHTVREIHYQNVEQTVHDYRFQVEGDTGQIEVEYSGRYHYKWERGYKLSLVATVHRHSPRWRCTRIKRPVEEKPSVAPLFEGG